MNGVAAIRADSATASVQSTDVGCHDPVGQRIAQALAMVSLLDFAGSFEADTIDGRPGFEFCNVLVADALGGAVSLLEAADRAIPDHDGDLNMLSAVQSKIAQAIGVLGLATASIGSATVEHRTVIAGLWAVSELLNGALSALDKSGPALGDSVAASWTAVA